jgi:tetratricopeptide (TPR) repeat protein
MSSVLASRCAGRKSVGGATLLLRFSMRSRFQLCFVALIAMEGACLFLSAQEAGGYGASDPLRLHYEQAETLQRAGKLEAAAGEYRAFLADALGELAMGYGLAHDNRNAEPLFDQALTLEPDSPELLLDAARTALTAGDLPPARALAAEFIGRNPGTRAQLALAHQVLGRTLLKMNQDQAARKELETAVDLDPTFPNGYDLAVACLDLGDGKCAQQIFAEMERSFGDTAEIHMAFGRAYGDSDFQPRAVTEFRRAIEENPRLRGAHYLLASVLLATGTDDAHVGEAEENLKKEIAISPRDAMSYTALGKIAATRNNDAEAEKWLKKAVALDPDNPDTWLYLGQMYFDSHRMDEAEDALRQCIRYTKDVSRNRYQVQKAHFLLGRILMQKGQANAASAEMKISRELANRTLSQDRTKLVGLMDTAGNQESASGSSPSPDAAPGVDAGGLEKVEALRRQLQPAIADSYNNLGAIVATGTDYRSAVGFFERAAEWNPALEGLDYNWGRAAFAGSMFADAVPPLTRYVQAHPEDSGARSVLGISAFETGKYQDCIDALRPVIDKGGLAPQVEYVYDASLVESGQVREGANRLAALEKAHPEISDVHRTLGEALDREGQTGPAVAELETAARLNPRDAGAHYDLGKIALATRDSAAAVSNLEAAVRLAPNNEEFHRELALAYQAALRPADAQREIDAGNALRAQEQKADAAHPAAMPQ